MQEENKIEIKDDELEKVTGGSTTENAPSEFSCSNNWVFTGFVGKYAESHIGEKLYLVAHSGNKYYYGTLRDSFEVEYTFSTERTHCMACEEKNGKPYDGFVEVSGDDYYLYRERTK